MNSFGEILNGLCMDFCSGVWGDVWGYESVKGCVEWGIFSEC